MGLQNDVRRPVGCHAERSGCLDKGRVDLVGLACGLDSPVYDLDEDALEDGPVEDLFEAGVGLFVCLPGLAQKQQCVVEGLHDIVDLGDGLVLPALDLGLLSCDALLFSLEDFDRDGIAVVELDKFLLLECQLVKASAVAFGFGLRRGSLGGDELTHGRA